MHGLRELVRFHRFPITDTVHFLCSPKENEPKERAPCPLVLWTSLRFSTGPGAQKLVQTSLDSDSLLAFSARSAMLGYGTMGIAEPLKSSCLYKSVFWISLANRFTDAKLKQSDESNDFGTIINTASKRKKKTS
jgi:hypothetical protein